MELDTKANGKKDNSMVLARNHGQTVLFMKESIGMDSSTEEVYTDGQMAVLLKVTGLMAISKDS